MADPPGTPRATPELIRLAAFVRTRLADMAALAGRTAGVALSGIGRAERPEPERLHGAGERLATVVVAPLATFAPTAHARARLLRQLHATGLLTQGEVEQALQTERQLRELPPSA